MFHVPRNRGRGRNRRQQMQNGRGPQEQDPNKPVRKRKKRLTYLQRLAEIRVTDEFKESIELAFEKLNTDDEMKELELPSSLSSEERKYVHLVAQHKGFKSRSTGPKTGKRSAIIRKRDETDPPVRVKSWKKTALRYGGVDELLKQKIARKAARAFEMEHEKNVALEREREKLRLEEQRLKELEEKNKKAELLRKAAAEKNKDGENQETDKEKEGESKDSDEPEVIEIKDEPLDVELMPPPAKPPSWLPDEPPAPPKVKKIKPYYNHFGVSSKKAARIRAYHNTPKSRPPPHADDQFFAPPSAPWHRERNQSPGLRNGDRPYGDDYHYRPGSPHGTRNPLGPMDHPGGPYGDRPPINSYGNGAPRNGYGDRPPSHGYGDRPPMYPSDRPPSRSYGDRPPSQGYGDRPPHPHGNRPPFHPYGNRPPINNSRYRPYGPPSYVRGRHPQEESTRLPPPHFHPPGPRPTGPPQHIYGPPSCIPYGRSRPSAPNFSGQPSSMYDSSRHGYRTSSGEGQYSYFTGPPRDDHTPMRPSSRSSCATETESSSYGYFTSREEREDCSSPESFRNPSPPQTPYTPSRDSDSYVPEYKPGENPVNSDLYVPGRTAGTFFRQNNHEYRPNEDVKSECGSDVGPSPAPSVLSLPTGDYYPRPISRMSEYAESMPDTPHTWGYEPPISVATVSSSDDIKIEDLELARKIKDEDVEMARKIIQQLETELRLRNETNDFIAQCNIKAEGE